MREEHGPVPFGPIADSLRIAVIDFYTHRGDALTGAAGASTLATNSELAEHRGCSLLEILYERTGRRTIEGLQVLELGCGFGSLAVYLASLGAFVTGVDRDQNRFEVGRRVAAQHDLPVEFRRAEIEVPDLPNGRFNLAILDNSLCFLIRAQQRLNALRGVKDALCRGGCLLIRNPNRWSPRDPFTGVPMLHLLPPNQATRVAGLLGRRRALVRLTSPMTATRELRRAGFSEIQYVASPSSRWPGFMKPLARYQHFIAER